MFHNHLKNEAKPTEDEIRVRFNNLLPFLYRSLTQLILRELKQTYLYSVFDMLAYWIKSHLDSNAVMGYANWIKRLENELTALEEKTKNAKPFKSLTFHYFEDQLKTSDDFKEAIENINFLLTELKNPVQPALSEKVETHCSICIC